MTSQVQSSAKGAAPLIVNPSHFHDPTPNGYSTVVVTPTVGRLAFISGQGGQDRTGGLSPDFGAQVAQADANLAAVLHPNRTV